MILRKGGYSFNTHRPFRVKLNSNSIHNQWAGKWYSYGLGILLFDWNVNEKRMINQVAAIII